MKPLFRYPGGKSKLKKVITQQIVASQCTRYVEPFFGGGSIGLEVLSCNTNFQHFHFNDFDIGIAAIWNAVLTTPKGLCALISEFVPSVSAFQCFKAELLSGKLTDITQIAFQKIAVHQMSFSGLGVKAGSPIGGVNQSSAYSVGCRWNPDKLCDLISQIHSLFVKHGVDKCTALDFASLLTGGKETFIYCDPPYYVQGDSLYCEGFSQEQHLQLCACLEQANFQWLLSYDDCAFIRELYSWAHISEVSTAYTINSINKNRKQELLISREPFFYFSVQHPP